MVTINLRITKARIEAADRTKTNVFDMTPYLAHGEQMQLNSVIAGSDLTRTPGGFTYNPNPRRVALLILPIQYLRSKNALATFMGSMKVPPSVKETIQAFDKAVQENTSLFQNTLDTMLQESDKNILEAETDGSPYFGAVNARFAEKFIQLKPKADEIIASMRKFLKIE